MDVEEVVEQTKEEIIAIHNAPILAAIDFLATKIERAQELYDSLLEFKTKVGTYQDGFNGVSGSKKNKLTDLDTSVLNNAPKDIYISGMNGTYVDMVDNRIPTGVFDWFINRIDTKLSSYSDDISRWETESSILRATLW